MNFAYVKLDKPKKGFFYVIKYKIKRLFNCVKRDKYIKENYYISKINDKSLKKLINMLKKDRIDFVIAEKGIIVNYNKLSGNYALKYMLPEVVKYCFDLIDLKIEEVFVCANEFTNEIVQIIRELSQKVKVVKGFDGIYIKAIKIQTEKVMRVFSEYKNFEKEELIEAEMLKINKYADVRKYIEMNKFLIKEIIGERAINIEEFNRITENFSKKY